VINTREQIYGGLLTFLAAAVGFNTISRSAMPEAELATAQMPVLEQLPSAEDAVQQSLNLPPKWVIRQPLMVYVSVPAGPPNDPSSVGDTILNDLLDAIETALAPSPATGYQTLGGLVVSCRFVGVIQKDPGYQSGIGAAAIAIEMVTTS
jgi:hypothetical protein